MASVDIATLIFVLSALEVGTMVSAIKNIWKVQSVSFLDGVVLAIGLFACTGFIVSLNGLVGYASLASIVIRLCMCSIDLSAMSFLAFHDC